MPHASDNTEIVHEESFISTAAPAPQLELNDDPTTRLRASLELHLRNRRWSEACEVAEQIYTPDIAVQLQHRLARNLAAFEQHRPDVYERILKTSGPNPYTVASSKTGHATIVFKRSDGSQISLSPGHDPLGAVNQFTTQLRDAHARGETFTLSGLGDGYLANWLANNPPKLALGMEQPIYIIEPDPQLVWSCMMIHDFSGSSGAIEQDRFMWFVGPDWLDQLRGTMFEEFQLPIPSITLRLGTSGIAIDKALGRLTLEAAAEDRRLHAVVEEHYRSITDPNFVKMLAPGAPRRPRVMLLTTRFSTVLQYSTRDTAEGFEQMGWDARVVIEKSPRHRISRVAMRKVLADFKPDLVFQLDHLRSEHGDLFPANLPFACWIQDHLPNLTNRKAGESVRSRDFILTNCAYRYHAQYSYPLRQCLHLSRGTRVPTMPTNWTRDGNDLTFVSNCTRHPQELADKIVAGIADRSHASIIELACKKIIDAYGKGRSLDAPHDLGLRIHEAEQELGTTLPSDEVRRRWCDTLWHPFNDTLYRQQALRWIVRSAEKLGLSLGLYGNGWDQNAEFAKYSRGYITYGPDLEELTRRSRINLQIVPYSCLHQRLLDGLVAGGFYLVRDHPRNRVPYQLMEFIDRHATGATTLAVARDAVDDAHRSEFANLLEQYRVINDIADPIAQLSELRQQGFLVMLPRLDEVCFSDQASLEDRITQFLSDPARGDTIAAEQRGFVETHFTYRAQMQRLTREVSECIARETQEKLP